AMFFRVRLVWFQSDCVRSRGLSDSFSLEGAIQVFLQCFSSGINKFQLPKSIAGPQSDRGGFCFDLWSGHLNSDALLALSPTVKAKGLSGKRVVFQKPLPHKQQRFPITCKKAKRRGVISQWFDIQDALCGNLEYLNCRAVYRQGPSAPDLSKERGVG